ncbi:MAG: polymer-forming cytoskeletal protein [Patescibacteria group bacterium]|nr:polymer-forming cytoskeletal protein [Patescibacteria group bacterium]
MFKNQQIDEKSVETIIGHSVKVKGNFQTDGGMQIDGEMEGSLKVGTDLIIGENAKIKADAQANRIMISGKIKGNIKANKSLELTETARIDGDIETKILSTEPGAQINGSIKMSEISGKEKIGMKEKSQKAEENNI